MPKKKPPSRTNTPAMRERVRDAVEAYYRNYGPHGDGVFAADVYAIPYFENGRWHASAFPGDNSPNSEICCYVVSVSRTKQPSGFQVIQIS